MHFNKSPSIHFVCVMFNCLDFASLHQLLMHMKGCHIYSQHKPTLDHRATFPARQGHLFWPSLLSSKIQVQPMDLSVKLHTTILESANTIQSKRLASTLAIKKAVNNIEWHKNTTGVSHSRSLAELIAHPQSIWLRCHLKPLGAGWPIWEANWQTSNLLQATRSFHATLAKNDIVTLSSSARPCIS